NARPGGPGALLPPRSHADTGARRRAPPSVYHPAWARHTIDDRASVLACIRIWFISQPTCYSGAITRSVFRMSSAFVYRNLMEVKGAHSFNAGHIDAVLIR